MGWLLFINAKRQILNNRTEFVDSIYLLTVTLAHLLTYLPQKIRVSYFEKSHLNIRKIICGNKLFDIL